MKIIILNRINKTYDKKEELKKLGCEWNGSNWYTENIEILKSIALLGLRSSIDDYENKISSDIKKEYRKIERKCSNIMDRITLSKEEKIKLIKEV